MSPSQKSLTSSLYEASRQGGRMARLVSFFVRAKSVCGRAQACGECGQLGWSLIFATDGRSMFTLSEPLSTSRIAASVLVTSRSVGLSGWLREKASSCRVKFSPREEAWVIDDLPDLLFGLSLSRELAGVGTRVLARADPMGLGPALAGWYAEANSFADAEADSFVARGGERSGIAGANPGVGWRRANIEQCTRFWRGASFSFGNAVSDRLQPPVGRALPSGAGSAARSNAGRGDGASAEDAGRPGALRAAASRCRSRCSGSSNRRWELRRPAASSHAGLDVYLMNVVPGNSPRRAGYAGAKGRLDHQHLDRLDVRAEGCPDLGRVPRWARSLHQDLLTTPSPPTTCA